MAKVTVECAACFSVFKECEARDVPKSFVCPYCGIGQRTDVHRKMVGHSHKRNYPHGHYENG